MKVIRRENWSYIFFEQDGTHYLHVICGSIGLFTRTVMLSEEEARVFKEDESKIKEMAASVQDNPNGFQSRISDKKFNFPKVD